jgi:hypothetical protein
MGGPVEFTRNYNDISTEHGFQFEFVCDRCGNGSRTQFKPFTMGAVNNVLDTASSLLGGIFGQASNVSSRVTEAQRERAREEALLEAIEQIRPGFVQCPRCSSWVCRKSCWNTKRGLCKGCAPDLGVEMAAAQSSRTIEEAWEKATVDEESQRQVDGDWKATKTACCPECDAPLANANVKFCPECGAKLNAVKHCTECGAKLQPGVKFCGECGQKVSG